MLSFLGTFVISLIVCHIFLFMFGGFFILKSIWATVVLAAFIIAILITAFAHQETKIEELEARIKILEDDSDKRHKG
ncbi:MAG: hypothetical protein GX625_16540 [Clostridiaceae bacterium]|nr:hypothetical protein [Clostridiaceae bacterium]